MSIEQRIAAPPEWSPPTSGDFRNAKEWMVGVEGVERLGEDSYRLAHREPDRQDRTRGTNRGARPRDHKLGLHLDRRGRRRGRRAPTPTAAAWSPTPASSTSSARSWTGPPASSAWNASPARTASAPSHGSSSSWKRGATDDRRRPGDTARLPGLTRHRPPPHRRPVSLAGHAASTTSWRPSAATKTKKNSPRRTT